MNACSILHFQMPDTKIDPNKFTQPKMKKTYQTRWWQLTYVLCSPGKLGLDFHPSWLAHIFFRLVGEKNHQPAKIFPPFFRGDRSQLSVFLDEFSMVFLMRFRWFFYQAFTHQWRHFQWTLSRGSRFFGFRLLEFWCKSRRLMEVEGMHVLHCIICKSMLPINL